MAIDAQSQRSSKILLNLSAGLDERGAPFADGVVKLTANLRFAASAGAAALSQIQGVPQQSAADNPSSNNADSAPISWPPTPAENLPTPGEWLDRLKSAKGFHADISLAEYLGVTKKRFSQWRTGAASLTVEEAWRVGYELGVNPLLVIASVNYHASDLQSRAVWLQLAGTIMPPRPSIPVGDPQETDGTPSSSMARAQSPAPDGGKHLGDKPPGLESQGAKWIIEEDEKLVKEYGDLIPVPDIAALHRRSIAAILFRLYKVHKLIQDAEMQVLCERYNVKFTLNDQPGASTEIKEQKPMPQGGGVFL